MKGTTMPQTDTNVDVEVQDIDLSNLDFSTLVGKEIALYSEQNASQPLKTRVVLVADRTLSVDRSGNVGKIDSLVNNQEVTLRFDYKGERVAVKGTLKRTQGGNCSIVLGEKVTPLSQRKFKRVDMSVPVKMARLSIGSFDKSKIARMRWLQTKTLNISGGGLLIEMGGFMESDSYLVLNLGLESQELPSLVLGHVRYCLQSSGRRYCTGIEFVTKEMCSKRFDTVSLKKFPAVMLEYDEYRRQSFGKSVIESERNENQQ